MKKIPLIPFDSQTHPHIQVQTLLDVGPQLLKVQFQLQGRLELVENNWPGVITEKQKQSAQADCGRRDQLWQSTCCEIFLQDPSTEQYWEFNFSPLALWNIYQFTNYRQNMREYSEIKDLNTLPWKWHFSSLASSDLWQMQIDLWPLLAQGHFLGQQQSPLDLRIGLTCVVKTNDEKISYWAVQHLRPQADFHWAPAFISSC